MTQSLKLSDLARFDPVACWLTNTLGFTPGLFGVMVIPAGTILYLATALLSGTLWSQADRVGLLQDPLPWVWVLLIEPIVFGYYLWSFQAIQTVLQQLERSQVLTIQDSELEEVNHVLIQAYRPKWRMFLALMSAGVFSLLVWATRFELANSWTSSHPLAIAMITTVAFGSIYLGSMLVLNLIANIWILHCILKRELRRREFNVNPLHPDRCGGLRPLSNYALKTAYLIGVFGLMVGFMIYQFVVANSQRGAWFVYLALPLYIGLSIVCFFGPLIAAHRGMKRAKENLLQRIAQQFQEDYSSIHNNLAGDAEALKIGTEKIAELRAFYTLTNEFPVWPVNIQIFRQFLLTVSSPVLAIAVSAFKNFLTSFLAQWGIQF